LGKLPTPLNGNDNYGLVTIIVPVYNSRERVARCAASLAGQTYHDLQIVLVDDGSKDGSGDICDAFAQNDGRIESVRKPNGGASSARNAGLDRAKGEWIAFVDADDYVSPCYIEHMLSAAQGDCDMAICRFAWVQDSSSDSSSDSSNSSSSEPFNRAPGTRQITGREACAQRFGKEISLYNRCWGKIFRAHLWAGLRFPEELAIGEDIYVSHALLYRAGRIAITDAVLYAYVQSAGGIMRSGFSPRHLLDALEAWQQGARFFSEAGEADLANIARRVYCSRMLDARCICKRLMPNEIGAMQKLRQRAAEAYRDVRAVRKYIDCSSLKARVYPLKFLLGLWCPPLYARIFVGKGTSL